MKNPLLYNSEIDIPLIMDKVSSVQKISVSDFNIPDRVPGARERELVTARQLAMIFARKYTRYSLAKIGDQIGQKDHATVLHACKTINNLIDSRNRDIIDSYNKLDGMFSIIKSDLERSGGLPYSGFVEVNEELSNINEIFQD